MIINNYIVIKLKINKYAERYCGQKDLNNL